MTSDRVAMFGVVSTWLLLLLVVSAAFPPVTLPQNHLYPDLSKDELDPPGWPAD